ncbi:MAG: hypothetical protein FWE35_07045 [Streptosporangiales bacterium]|nr:hypothetical protein [Streptosporangiales bacterium]
MPRAWWRGRLAAWIAALAACVISSCMLASPARADTYTSFLVQQLRHDPVYISSYSPNAQPGDAARLRQLLSRIPLKTYVIADVAAGPDGEMSDSDLAAQLHDQLGGGLFIISRLIGDASATGYGTPLPVGDAMEAAKFQMPAADGYPTLLQLTSKFVPILLSGHTEQQLKVGEHMVEQNDKADRPAGAPAGQVTAVTAGGAVLGGGAVLALARRRRRRRRHRRRITPGPGVAGTLGIAGLLALAPASLTHSVMARPGAAAAPPDGIAAVARGLSSSPLYVDPDMRWMFTAAQEKRISAALRSSPVPVYVMAVPLSTDDDSPDYVGYSDDQLYHRTHRDGVYLTVGPEGDIYDAEYQVPRNIYLSVDTEQEPLSLLQPAQVASSVPGRMEKLISAVAAAPKDPQAAGVPSPQYSPGEFTGGRTADDSHFDTGGTASNVTSDLTTGGVLGLVIGGPLLALLALAGAGSARRSAASRRGWGDDGDAGTPVGHMPAAPSAGWLRRHAEGELAELERLIDSGGETNPGWDRALDDYDAGRLAATGDAEPIDLAGAIVLARDGRMALQQRLERPPAPCLVNPLHGRATEAVTAQALGLGAGAEHAFRQAGRITACDKCRRATAGQRRERALKVRHNGTTMGYTDFDSVWRKRLFGATGPGLPQAVREHLHVS